MTKCVDDGSRYRRELDRFPPFGCRACRHGVLAASSQLQTILNLFWIRAVEWSLRRVRWNRVLAAARCKVIVRGVVSVIADE